MIESIREIDRKTWLLGEKLLLTRTDTLLPSCGWSDGCGGGYQISEVQHPLPHTRPLSDTSDIKLVYSAGYTSAVYQVGEVFCKVKILRVPQATREHTTLAWLHQRSWSFSLPDVIYHTEHNGRHYLFLTRAPGKSVDSVWPSLDEPAKQFYVNKIVDICSELKASASGTCITGIDGNFLTEQYLAGNEIDCSPESLYRRSVRLGMDTSKLVFYHCDMGPTNVFLDTDTGSVSVIDWETAGFVPEKWIRTKFRLSSGMNLSGGDEVDWRRRIGARLGEVGFEDVVEEFVRLMRAS